jgi:ferritin-like protein
MSSPTISIEVDERTARAFAAASEDERRRLQLLLALRLRELTDGPPRSLNDLLDEIGARAKAQGLTPEILESLLNGA